MPAPNLTSSLHFISTPELNFHYFFLPVNIPTNSNFIMQSVAVFLALFACAAATNLVYNVPAVAYNSAVVKSDRLGGNFAYSVGTHPTYYTAGVVPAAVSHTYNSQVYKTPVYTPIVNTPLTYTSSVVAAGTPAHTYKTVAGVSPVYYNNLAYSQYGYPAHHVVY